MDTVSIFIDINKLIIDIKNSFIDINKYGLNVKTAAHSCPPFCVLACPLLQSTVEFSFTVTCIEVLF